MLRNVLAAIEEADHRELKKIAAVHGLRLRDIFTKAIRMYLDYVMNGGQPV